MKRPPLGRRFAQRTVSEKPAVHRVAVVEGEIALSPRGRSLLHRSTDKGRPFDIAATAGLLAMKRTSDLIPHCHLVPLTGSRIEIRRTAGGVRVRATAEAVWRTGVEMEALLGASVALLTLWDIAKTVEKEENGGYPHTRIRGIRVVRKKKEAVGLPV